MEKSTERRWLLLLAHALQEAQGRVLIIFHV